MSELHGIIYAYGAYPELGELTRARCAASLPFCGRYRLIDFALSSLMNAGVHNVGVIMQRDYQSLLDHLGSGKDWEMGRRIGGLKMLPPFGLPEYHRGDYQGTIEALNAVSTYVRSIREKYIIMMHGNLAANLDISEVLAQHKRSGVEITAVCSEEEANYRHLRYIKGADGFAERLAFDRCSTDEGLQSLEAYIINRDTLIRMMDACAASNRFHFHRDGICDFIDAGGKVGLYLHKGYARMIMNTAAYFQASMDALRPEARRDLFPDSRPVRSKTAEDVSTYYGENACVRSSLVADGCIIEGELQNCIVFPDVRIKKCAKLKNCIIMKSSVIGEGAEMSYVIADKYSSVEPYQSLSGSNNLQLIIPKNAKI